MTLSWIDVLRPARVYEPVVAAPAGSGAETYRNGNLGSMCVPVCSISVSTPEALERGPCAAESCVSR